MAEKTLHGSSNEYLGRVSTDSSGNKTLYGDHGQYLGRYSASGDTTHGDHGQHVGRGDQLGYLLGKKQR